MEEEEVLEGELQVEADEDGLIDADLRAAEEGLEARDSSLYTDLQEELVMSPVAEP